MNFERARKVADAVLYEGYVLYPYRASATKNQLRWQFGVLAPRAWCEAGGCENSSNQTECLLAGGPDAKVHGKVRFLQLQQRTVEQAPGVPVPSLEIDGQLFTSWDEGVEREIDFTGSTRFELPGGREVEPLGGAGARLVRERWPITGEIHFSTERLDGGLVRLRVQVENVTAVENAAATRDEALRSSLTGAHLLLGVDGGEFVSLLDPPEESRAAAANCRNLRTWPVLIDRGLVLSSPIILPDHPEVAKESPGDLYDATEIDEILTLRTRALTDQEKREARSTDARAAAIVDRVDHLPAEMLEKLHGAVRSLQPETPAAWWDPGADASVSPETDSVEIGGVSVAKGSVVRLHPGQRADAQDMFLEGRLAQVQGVYLDVEDRRYLAVTLEDDPAADLHQWHGRFFYFSPDEVEPAAAKSPRASTLVAGVGNIFFGDDGFGVEVARRLQSVELPAGVRVADFGIRGVHLAYQLLDGYDTLILVDAIARGEAPGTVSLIEPQAGGTADASMDAHGMDPAAVLALVRQLGGRLDRVLVVGCEPAEICERMGLSEPVARAVDEAARLVRRLVVEPVVQQ